MGLILEHPRQVARHFGVNIRTIQRWIRRGLPRLSGGLFDVDEIEAWLKKQGPAEDLQAKPREFEYLSQPVADDVAALYGAGIGEMRKGLKTLARGLTLGHYRSPEARIIIFKIIFGLLLEQLNG